MDEINGEDVLPPMGIIFSTSLVELERIQQLEELAVLLRVLQLDVVLLQPVQCQLGLVVDVDLHGILHELLARAVSAWPRRQRRPPWDLA